MSKTKRIPNRLLKLLYFLAGIVVVFILLYGYIFIASQWGRESIVVDGIKREYRVYVPSSYNGEGGTVPLVMAFHMLTGSGRTMEWLTHFNKIADKEGFIVVYLDGYEASWADGSNLYAADENHINDVAFVAALIDKLSSKYKIDTGRIYATGFSNGGFMVQRLGCELSDKITAIATVGATLSTNTLNACNPLKPMAVLMINGTDEHSVPWEGNSDYASVSNTINFWRKHNGCSDASETLQLPNIKNDDTFVKRDTYKECIGDSAVVLYTIVGGGHTWAGGNQAVQLWGLGGRINQDIDASQVIWSFFQEQR